MSIFALDSRLLQVKIMNEISNSVIELYDQLGQRESMSINEEMVKKAINIVLYLHPKNEDEVFLMLCALNLLNAAIKTELFKDNLSYDLIKTNAAKLVAVIDALKNNDVSYYYNKDEYCLYLKYGDVVFSFHHVPLTSEILKASFASPISWPGIRLQKIAQPLMNLAIRSFENDIAIKEIIERPIPAINEIGIEQEKSESIDREYQDKDISKDDVSSINVVSTEISTLSAEERASVATEILAIISKTCTPDPEGWFDLTKIAPKLKANGINYSLYGFTKLILFLEAIFGNSLQRRNVGNTMVFLRFPLDDIPNPSNITNNFERNQESLDILNGVQLGDNVEINTFGVLKSGIISILNKQFVQLELKDNRSIRIKCDAITSIESKFSSNNIDTNDLSFANAIIKDVLVAEGLYSSLTILTNATITMVESRRIWLTTDDSNTGSCYKGSIIGYNKEKLVKGQRVFVSSLKKEKAYLVIMEMSYYELYEVLEDLLSSSNKLSDFKKSQILFLLTFVMKNIGHTESLAKIKELKQQLKSLMYSSTSSSDEIEEEIKNDDEVEMESSHEILKEYEASYEDIGMNHSDEEKSQAEKSHSPLSEEIYKPEITPIQGPKIIGKIDLTEISASKKKKEGGVNDPVSKGSNDSISIDSTVDLLPSMGKIKKMWAAYGYIKPYNQEKDLYFYTSELISYAGIIESPSVGDEVVYTLGQNSQGPIALCIHKQCTKDIVEDLVEKFRYDTKTCSRLKKHIDDFDNFNTETSDNTEGLSYYLKIVGVNPKISFSPNDVEKKFAEILTPTEYSTAIEYLIDEVVKKDPSKCYNLFLRSSSYARSHKMYDVSKHLIEKALEVFKGEPGKIRYFKDLFKKIDSLSNRIKIDENTLAESLEISNHAFPFMPTYVRDIILTTKVFKGITLDKETSRTGLYKEEYIKELKDNIKQNNADDSLYLTMMILQLAFHSKEYNPKDDISNFLVNRAKNILANEGEHSYSDVRYLLRLAYRIKNFDKGFDDTVGLYLMTLGDYKASDIDLYMSGRQSDYKFDDLLKNILLSKVDNTLELTLLAESNVDIKKRIIREYEKIGKNIDSFDEYPTIVKEIKKRYIQYSANPAVNFMSFISYLQTSAILLDNEMNIMKNDFVKVVNSVTNFNTSQKYNIILDAYNDIIQKIEAIRSNLLSHPTEMGYETILPALGLLKNDVHVKFKEIEQRVNPTISIDILESVGSVDTNTAELKVEIKNSGDSARHVYINSLKVSGDDLLEANNINIDGRLSAGEDGKIINIELPLCDNAVNEKVAEVEFEIEYDDIYIATDQRISKCKIIHKTINFFEIKSFAEIENKFRPGAGGGELESGNSMFYGRESIISNIQQAILNGTKNQIAIYGQKRSGKSSLLNQIIGRLKSDKSHSVICGKFNLQGLFTDEDEKEEQDHDDEKDNNPVKWILKSIAEALLRGMLRSDAKKLGKDIKDILSKFFSVESDAFTALRDFIEQINTIDGLQDSHFVIFIDEFTYLYQLIKSGKVSEDFMRRWIALIETPGINLQTIVAAQDTLPHFMNESYASNCFNKFSKEPLSYLSKDEALQLIKNPIKDIKFHNHSEELIYEYTSGSAFFTQIFCMRLVDYLNSEKKSTVVGKDEIETVAELLCTGIYRLEKSTFECLTKEADGSDFEESDNEIVLKAIAERTRAGGHVNMEDLHVDFPQEKLKSVLDNLYARRVISKQDKGYSINVKLFVKWMLNN